MAQPVYTAELDVPDQGIVGALLSAAPVAGYTCIPNSGGRYLSIRFKIGNDNTKVASGDPANAAPLGPHTIRLFQDGVQIKSYDLIGKQSRTHFRLPLNPNANIIPFVTPQQLVDARLMFPVGVADFHLKAIAPVPYDDPNGFPGMYRGWGAAGERPELGIVSEWAARYMATGSPADLANVLAIAEGGGTAPLFYLDPSTGKIVDVIANPHANDYGAGGNYHGFPWFKRALTTGTAIDIGMSMNHAPEPNYLAGLLTRDPQSVINCQCWANQFLIDNGGVAPDGRPFLTADEQRSLAWALRGFGQAHVLTREFERLGILPQECQPSGYFATVLKNTREILLQPLMDDPSLELTRFFWGQQYNVFLPWQQNYISEALGYLVLTGHTEFNDAYLWHLGCVVRQTSGLSGWPAGLPCSFWIYVGDAGSRLKTWGDIWNEAKKVTGTGPGAQDGGLYTQAMIDALELDQYNGGQVTDTPSLEYAESAHGAISIALHLHSIGKVDVFAAWPEIGQCYGNAHRMLFNVELSMQNPDGTDKWSRTNSSPSWYCNARNQWTFDLTKFAADTFTPGAMPSPMANASPPPPLPAPPPPVITPEPPPVITPPPGTGEPPMSAPQFLRGSKHVITLSAPLATDGSADKFLPGTTASVQILNSDDSSPATDQGSVDALMISGDGLTATIPLTVGNTDGDYFSRVAAANPDGAAIKINDFEFGVIDNDVGTATQTIS